MAGGKLELADLMRRVRAANCTTIEQVGAVVDGYFATVSWSALKEEWNKHMSSEQREMFVARLFLDTRSRCDD